MKQEGYHIVALETGDGAQSIETFTSHEPIALVLGNEVEGIPSDVLVLCDVKVEIPMIGVKRSLNVSVATGIALFALSSKKR